MNALIKCLREERAATTTEYAVVLALIFLAVLTVVIILGQGTASNIKSSATQIENATTSKRELPVEFR